MLGANILVEGPCKVYKPNTIILDLDGLLDFSVIDIDVFVPYIRNNMIHYLQDHWNSDEVANIVNELRKESFDGKFVYHYNCPLIEDDEPSVASVLAYMEWQHHNLPESQAIIAIHKKVLDRGMDEGKINLTQVSQSFINYLKNYYNYNI